MKRRSERLHNLVLRFALHTIKRQPRSLSPSLSVSFSGRPSGREGGGASDGMLRDGPEQIGCHPRSSAQSDRGTFPWLQSSSRLDSSRVTNHTPTPPLHSFFLFGHGQFFLYKLKF